MFHSASPPTTEAYLRALDRISGQLGELQWRILAIQFNQPGRAITSQRLRDELGYKGIAASNGAYGRLGHLMATAVGYVPDSRKANRMQWWSSLSTGDASGRNFLWFMRPQLAEALVRRGMVDADTDGMENLPDPDIPAGLTAMEGRLLLRSHLARERNRALVAEKKRAARNLRCEVCEFDPRETYGVDYCEVHHLVPLAELDGTMPTRLEDLAILCANCHRIIHLTNPPLTLDALRGKLRLELDC